MTTTQLRPLDATDEPPRPGRRRRRIALAAAGVVVLGIFLTWLIAFSSAFGVRTVHVRGEHTLTAAQVLSAADVPHGTPLVRLDTAAITTRVQRLPDVASAQVTTSFPSTVVVTVVERTPVAYISAAGRVTLVDRTGARYRTAATAPKSVPKLVMPGDAPTSRAMAEVAGALPPALRSRVRSIEALDPGSITLVLTGGKIVRWGADDRNAQKAQVVEVLRTRDVVQIDVTDPDQPFTRSS